MFNDSMYDPRSTQPTSQEIAMRARAKEHQLAVVMARYQNDGREKNRRGLLKLLTSLLTGLR